MDTYNGWSSYETWCAVVWGFTEDFITESRDVADIMLDKDTDREEKIDAVANYLSDRFDAYTDDILPRDVVTSIFGDFISSASNRIDWQEIAESWYDDNSYRFPIDDDTADE